MKQHARTKGARGRAFCICLNVRPIQRQTGNPANPIPASETPKTLLRSTGSLFKPQGPQAEGAGLDLEPAARSSGPAMPFLSFLAILAAFAVHFPSCSSLL